jgi:lipopolysaccharide export system ATP-binding protein
MVVGLVQADKGAIHLDENNITHMPMHARAQQGLGYLPQEASVFRKLSVEDNILAVLEAKKEFNKKQRQEKLDALIDDLKIDHIRHNIGLSLSGGERRRVEIARALASQPAFVLLDEPFAGVDPISVIEIQKIVKHLTDRNIGVLITDHNVRETLGICNRAYILSGGKIIAQGQPDEILSNEEVREVYLGRNFRL